MCVCMHIHIYIYIYIYITDPSNLKSECSSKHDTHWTLWNRLPRPARTGRVAASAGTKEGEGRALTGFQTGSGGAFSFTQKCHK